MNDKFKVGDKVYDILRGVGKVVGIDSETAKICNVVEVLFNSRTYSETYSQKGFWDNSYANPTLLTISEAKAKGYDVPKEKKRTEVRYCLVHDCGGVSGVVYNSKEELEIIRNNKFSNAEIATVTYEWEEESK